jgi:hypothetical protein
VTGRKQLLAWQLRLACRRHGHCSSLSDQTLTSRMNQAAGGLSDSEPRCSGRCRAAANSLTGCRPGDQPRPLAWAGHWLHLCLPVALHPGSDRLLGSHAAAVHLEDRVVLNNSFTTPSLFYKSLSSLTGCCITLSSHFML